MENGRSRLKEKDGRLEISIPSKKNWPLVFIGIFWLTGWSFGLKHMIKLISEFDPTSIDYFLVVWVVGWLLGGSSVIGTLLWSLLGREKLILDRNEVILKKSVLGLGRKKKLSKEKIIKLRRVNVCSSPFSGCRVIPFSNSIGKITFDYGLRSYSVGLSLDSSEVDYLLQKIEYNLLNKYGFSFDETPTITLPEPLWLEVC